MPIFGDAGGLCLVGQRQPDAACPATDSAYAAVLRLRDTWWFCCFYSITFGGFVGLASYLDDVFSRVNLV